MSMNRLVDAGLFGAGCGLIFYAVVSLEGWAFGAAVACFSASYLVPFGCNRIHRGRNT